MAELSDAELARQIGEACTWLDRAIEEMEKRGYHCEIGIIRKNLQSTQHDIAKPFKLNFSKMIYW